MKRLLLAATALFAMPAAANALAVLNDANGCGGACQGLTYTLESAIDPTDSLTMQFALVITGQNSGSDTIGGRSGINAIAFNLVTNNPDSPYTGTFLGTRIDGVTTLGTNGWVFVGGGLNSSGCNQTGNFFCFDNTAIPPTPGTALSTNPIVLGFEATLLAGQSWDNYAPSFKIDWVGSAQNYSLVSKDIPVNETCPDCVINPVVIVPAPEPASLALLGAGVLGLAAIRRRRNG